LLVTGAGGSAGNNVCWSLRVSPDGKGTDIIGTDSEKTSLELNRWIDAAYTIPVAKNPKYIQILNKIITRRKIQAVFPQPDPEVGRISRDRHLLSASVFLPDKVSVENCLDKFRALSIWHENGLRARPVVLQPPGKSLQKSIEALNFPLWLRARQGAGGSMSCLAKSRNEAYYWVMFHWAQGFDTDFIAEEYLPGRDFCFMSLWNEGKLVTSMVRERLSWVGNRLIGTGGTSKLNKVVHSEPVNSTAIRTIKAISKKPHGIFCVDLKGDTKGEPLPTEINCRFTTNVHYLTLASLNLARPELNFAWIAGKLSLGEEIPDCQTTNAVPANIWFTKNTDMGITMVLDDQWRAAQFN